MRMRGINYPIFQVELWHGTMVLVLLVVLVPMGVLEPYSLLLGGLFMGVNFLLLGFGIQYVLTPFAGKGRVRSGILLLTLKLVLFLGLLSVFFLEFSFDAISFALGISCLLVATVAHGLRYRKDYLEATR